MRVFLLDLWLDLREKRLAPLAILLLVGIIAVPVVLAKPEASVAPPPAHVTAAAAPATPIVSAQASDQQVDSKLQTFSTRDPFEPTASAATATTTTTTTSSSSGTSTGSSTSSSSGTSGSSGSGGSNSSSGGSGGGGATTGSGPVTTTPGGGGTGGSGNGSTGNTTGQTKTTLFTYTVDLRFGQAGDVKAYKGVKRLDLIPTDKNPKIVFLGVTTTGKTAVFLVDSNIGVDTPGGRCRPSADECTFLYLRADGSHDTAVLTDSDGTVYHLRLLGINRVSVSSANGGTTNNSSGSNGSGSGTKRSPAFTGSAGRTQASDGTSNSDTPPGEPDNRSSFQQFFADSGR